MRSLEEQMSFYAAYHQHPRNKATHFIGVPFIMLALLVPLAWMRVELLGFHVSAAILLAAAVLAYYFVLDAILGAAMLAVLTALIWLGELIAALPAVEAWTGFGLLFVGGWALQLLGHVLEGRKPAFADNLWQIFVAPIFLAAEVFFWLGWKPELRQRVSSSARRARATPSP